MAGLKVTGDGMVARAARATQFSCAPCGRDFDRIEALELHLATDVCRMVRGVIDEVTQPTRPAAPKALPCYYCSEHHSDAEPCPERDSRHRVTAPLPKAPDLVNHPSHYTDGKIEVWDFIVDKALNFLRGNVVKYVCRAGKKDKAAELQDLEKARAYLDREIARLKAAR